MPDTKKGRYEIRGKLGEGGMGVVFRAYDPPPMDRDVALKTLPAFPDPLALDLFYKECKVLKSISHPNVVEIFDMGECEDEGQKKPFFVMPLLPGQTLEEIMRTGSHRLTVPRIVDIMSQTCRGLQAAHDRGLIHRDLKPSNIFVMADDSVKIIDFGVAHTVDLHSRSIGYAKGTLLYMAPEQVQHKPVSAQSDIFSLAVVCYEALTRRQPFRGTTEDDIVEAIVRRIPPPASEINPAVGQTVSRAVHKAMAKQPWNRYDSVRDFGETLQKALRNEPIELFDPARIKPRLQRATTALENGDHAFAGEIVGELEAEGNIDSQLTLLRTQIDQVTRQKTIAQLLEGARARFEEDEDPLALQKLQEVLRLDPNHAAALGLKARIEERRSERQIEQWMRLARQHVDNHSYAPAREALQNVMSLRRNDGDAARLLKDIEAEEHEYLQLRRQKSDKYQAALNAWKNGEVSQALSQMKVVLELDRRAPDTSSPDTGATYQVFYNKVRSEHDAIKGAYADARRQLAEGEVGRALETCDSVLTKYPGDALFQALRFDVQEQQRQRLSAFIADVDRRLEAEPDLNAKVHLLKEAISVYPEEAHFRRPLQLTESKRDLVDSIVARARVHEERGEINEALSDLEILQTIYSPYPGLKFERERLEKRLAQQGRQAAKAAFISQVDRRLEAGEYVRALELLDGADCGLREDVELVELRQVAEQGRQRDAAAEHLFAEGQQLCAAGEFDRGLATLTRALQLADRVAIRATLRDLLVERAQACLDDDWRSAEGLTVRALELDPAHLPARSLQAHAADRRRDEFVSGCVSKARQLQAAGDVPAAAAEVDAGLLEYPAEPRLISLRESLGNQSARTVVLPAQAPHAAAAAAAAMLPDATVVRPLPPAAASKPDVPATPLRHHARIARISVTPRRLAMAAATLTVIVGAVTLRTLIPADASERPRIPEVVPVELLPEQPAAPSSAVVPSSPLRIVAADMDSSEVWVDDKMAGTIEDGTFVLDALSSGGHVLKIVRAKSGQVRASLAFTTGQNGVTTVAGITVEDTGAVVIGTHAAGARIHTTLADVPITVDGNARGVVTMNGIDIQGLAPGVHELMLGAGATVRKLSFIVAQQPATEVLLFSDRNVGSALVITGHDDATVFVDGRPYKGRIRQGQLRVQNLTPSEHSVRVVKDGFEADARTVAIVRGQEAVLKFDLKRIARPASLTVEGLQAGTHVSVGDTLVGTAAEDGVVSHGGIAPGSHTVALVLAGHQSQRIVREFLPGASVTLSGIRLVRAVGALHVLAEQTTGVVIERTGETERRLMGTGSISLPEGTYVVSARGPVGVPRTSTVTIDAGETKTLDLRSIVTGLELFEAGTWTTVQNWATTKGGGFVLYPQRPNGGTFTFSLRASRGWMPFSNGKRLKWVASFRDARNYVLFEIDGKFFYRHEVLEGKRDEGLRVPHNLRDNGDAFHVTLEVSGNRLVHQVSADGKAWRTLDDWSADRPGVIGAHGRFGFYVPGDDEVRVANFLFYPEGVR